MTLHTRTFSTIAVLSGIPSVAAVFSYAMDANIAETGFGTGIIFTYSAVLCVGALFAAMVSCALDLFERA